MDHLVSERNTKAGPALIELEPTEDGSAGNDKKIDGFQGSLEHLKIWAGKERPNSSWLSTWFTYLLLVAKTTISTQIVPPAKADKNENVSYFSNIFCSRHHERYCKIQETEQIIGNWKLW